MIKGNFIDNLPKVYGIYTGGFLAFIIIMAIGAVSYTHLRAQRPY